MIKMSQTYVKRIENHHFAPARHPLLGLHLAEPALLVGPTPLERLGLLALAPGREHGRAELGAVADRRVVETQHVVARSHASPMRGAVDDDAGDPQAGFFVGIALADLLPEVAFHDHDRGKLTLVFLLGILLAYAIGSVEPAGMMIVPLLAM